MKRMGVVGVGFVLVAALAAAVASPATAAYKAEYKMSVRTTQTSPWGAGAQKFADTVREKSGGLINIKVYFNGALFADDQTKEFMLTKQGVADFALGSTINWSPQLRALNLFNLPFMFPSYEALDAVKNGNAGKMIKDQMDKFGVIFLGWGENGYRELMQKLYEPKVYYQRIRTFLENHRTRGPRLRVSFSDFQALLKSFWMLGIWESGRHNYWRFFWSILLRRPHQMRAAIELAVIGYHFRRVANRL